VETSFSSGENSDRGINQGDGEDIRGEHGHSGGTNGGDREVNGGNREESGGDREESGGDGGESRVPKLP
jgi:hypothetical protein